MLEYCKMITKKVSFDLKLFEKEFIKSLAYLGRKDRKVFLSWSLQEYNGEHNEVVKRYYKM